MIALHLYKVKNAKEKLAKIRLDIRIYVEEQRKKNQEERDDIAKKVSRYTLGLD